MRIIGNRGNTARKVQAVASGALASGDTVIVNANGTVSVVAETSFSESTGSPTVFESAPTSHISAVFDSSSNRIVVSYSDDGTDEGTSVVGTVSGTSISFGTPVVFEAAFVEYVASAFDTASGKVVIAYRDKGNSNAGTAIVGTINASNNSISFGSATVYDSNAVSDQTVTFDSSENRVVIAYNVGTGKAIVGTVSGTSISFGTGVQFNASAASNSSATYDSSSSKVVIAYKDNSNNYGTAIVGTVSGTGISFGTKVAFESAHSRYMSAVYDSSNNKVVIGYSDLGNSTYATAIVGTVSGTAISFGTPVVFESAAVYSLSAAYDTAAKKVTIAYSDDGNGQYGTLISGAVSGTTISFGSPSVFQSTTSNYISATFDSNADKVVIAYQKSNTGTSLVHQNAYSVTNLTAENYIGIASNGYATGQAATINVKGFIDDNQSSLTAGQSYYVQTNGDLGLTAADPSVFAGTAVSATKLIVKG
mgnify:CR=1 FL=1